MKRTLTLVAVVAAAVALIGCGGKKEREPRPAETVGLEQIGGTEWVLRWWDRREPALLQDEITLNYADGRFTGSNGCNNYFHGVEEREGPGAIFVGVGGATKKSCPDPAGANEVRFAQLLQAVHHMAIRGGELELKYELDGKEGAMIFKPRQARETE